MKTLLKSYLTLSFVALLASCGKTGDIKINDALTIDLNQELTEMTPVMVREIPLSTGSSEPVGHVSKFIPTTDGFFILDAIREIVWKFNEAGEMQAKLHRLGNGPGEYASVNGIDVYPNGDLALLDTKGNKIHRYDRSLNYVSSTKIPASWARDFAVADSTSYFLNQTRSKEGIVSKLGYFDSVTVDPLIKRQYENEEMAFGSSPTHSGDRVPT